MRRGRRANVSAGAETPPRHTTTRHSPVDLPNRWTEDRIIKRVIAAHGGEVRDHLTGRYLERGYCVQYHESDLNFVCRLLEEGAFFFFEHARRQHVLVL